jgi:hypothetical protein
MIETKSPGVTLERSPDADDEFSGHVTLALELQKRIKEDTARLENLKAILRDEAQLRLPAGKRRDPSGEVVWFTGVCGKKCRVTFPRPRSISAFWFRDGQAFRYKNDKVTFLGDIKKFAGRCFKTLFYPQFKPTKDFAVVVRGLVEQKKISQKKAAQLVSMCVEDSTPKVELDPNS